MGGYNVPTMSATLLTLLLGLFSFSAAEPVRTAHVTAELVAENSALRAGQKNWIGLRLETIPHWHTYWRFPGDSGLATKVKWTLPEGGKISGARWPLPTRIHLPPLVNFGFEHEALIGFELDLPAGATGPQELVGEASWLVCKEECVPEKATLRLSLPVGEGKPNPWRDDFEKLRKVQPAALPANAAPALLVEENRVGLRLNHAGDWLQKPVDFFPLAALLVKGVEAPKPETRGEHTILWMEKAAPFASDAAEFPGELIVGKGADRRVYSVNVPMAGAKSVPATADISDGAAPGILVAALLAFLGGVLLNLMPCVFPVLGIKVMALVSQGGNNQWHARVHGKVYGLGVLVSFWVLTAVLLVLRSAGESVGWGFQLQQPGFVILLIWLFSLLAANLAGFFEIGGRFMGAGAALAGRDGISGSFFTGILAVVVATPCTAPFMGTAIGVVLSQPAWAVFVVFTALGLGLAAPFVLLCYQPALLRALPRPGVWMQRLKEFFAFPMAATVLWLFWVLGMQLGLGGVITAAFGLLLMFFSHWLLHALRFPLGRLLFWLGLVASVVVTSSALRNGRTAVATAGEWKSYSAAAVEEARKKGPVFVDFTAAWCLTCQVNKSVVLDRSATQEFFRAKGVTIFLADWTNSDPEITKALERHGRIGVPLYLAYVPGREQPEILPQLLTDDIIKKAFP